MANDAEIKRKFWSELKSERTLMLGLGGDGIVREGYQVMLISDGGTVIRTAVDGIKRSGRATQGVIVMRLREGEQVSSLAPVMGSDDETDAELAAEAEDTVADAVEAIDGDAD